MASPLVPVYVMTPELTEAVQPCTGGGIDAEIDENWDALITNLFIPAPEKIELLTVAVKVLVEPFAHATGVSENEARLSTAYVEENGMF